MVYKSGSIGRICFVTDLTKDFKDIYIILCVNMIWTGEQ